MYNPRLVRTIVFERTLPGTNEVFGPDGAPRPVYEAVLGELEKIGPRRWKENLHQAHGLLLDEQHAFGIREGDKTHPTDWFPRVVPASNWERLERGLIQRMQAINEFLRGLEAGTQDVVPEEVLETSILYDPTLPNRFGEVPVRQAAFDVVAVESARPGQSGGWEFLVLEENAKMPVGLAAMTRRRRMSAEVFFHETLAELPVLPLDGWLERLGDALRAASPKGADATLAVVSSGPADQFYLDHHIYAEEMNALLAETKDLEMDGGGYLVHGPTGRRIDVIYERVDEDTLYAEVPGLLECHLTGKVHVLFAPNSEIIDDKGVYAGKEVMIGPEETKESVDRFRRVVEKNPVEYVAQEVIDFSTHVLCATDEDDFLLRDSYADYRMLVLTPDPYDPDVVETVPGSLSRVAAPGKHVVNISSGGKMKDTWVLER